MNLETLIRKTWIGSGYILIALSILSLICKLIVKYS